MHRDGSELDGGSIIHRSARIQARRSHIECFKDARRDQIYFMPQSRTLLKEVTQGLEALWN
jgi:hypothetical protein